MSLNNELNERAKKGHKLKKCSESVQILQCIIFMFGGIHFVKQPIQKTEKKLL